tara:strand:+ start:2917 stop:4089 length:1173 start_codon:yes stop_codon:yes gene_type:complete
MNRFNLVSASLNPVIFSLYRKYMYLRYNDTKNYSQGEIIHEKSKKHLLYLSKSLKSHSNYFQSDDSNKIIIKTHEFPNPVGLASGFDKNCELFAPMSYVFGLVTIGTVLKNENPGNIQKPKDGIKRLIVNPNNKSIINSQGYPSLGLDYAVDQLKKNHKNRNRKSKLILSFSGVSNSRSIDDLLTNSEEIIKATHEYVDGYEDSRSSPNTEFNKLIQTEDITSSIMSILNSHAPSKLKLLKISPYSSIDPPKDEIKNKLQLIEQFHESGGDMVILNNSLSINVKETYNISNFNKKNGGLSGDPLYPYTEKLVESVHQKFKNLPIIACGGITNGQKAWNLLNKGASLFEIYSGMTFYGLNLIIQINNTLKSQLSDSSINAFLNKRNKNNLI